MKKFIMLGIVTGIALISIIGAVGGGMRNSGLNNDRSEIDDIFVDGLDVSHWQGDINWNDVYNDGYRFAFAKATEGTGYVDDHFTTNMEEAHAAGLYMGAYHFAHPGTPLQSDAYDEADYFVDNIQQYLVDGYLVPALDLENNDNSLSWSELTDWANYFCERIYDRTGIKPVIYTSTYWANHLGSSIIQWSLWIANYDVSSPDTGVWSTWAFWQYRDDGSVSGISGNVDLDYYNGDINSLYNNFVIHQSSISLPYYDRQAAYGYAYRWWNGRNTHYNDYSSSGGDCANFGSQCLIAGGLSLWKGYDGNGGGVYSDSNGTIPFCDYLHQNLVKYQNVKFAYVTSSNFSVPSWLEMGDIIIFGDASGDHWKHTTIVVYRNGNDVGVAAHSTDRWNYSINNYFPGEFDRINYYHIEDGNKTTVQPFRVTATNLNVRVGPSTDYQILGTIQNGEEYVSYDYYIDSSGNKWWKFFYDDRVAWCASWYTEEISADVFQVDVQHYLNVRTGPGTNYNIAGQVYHGMLFVKIGEQYNSGEGRTWYEMWWSSEQRWVASEYTEPIPELSMLAVVISMIILSGIGDEVCIRKKR